jgi:putative addiction module component (TIGR02574 family)
MWSVVFRESVSPPGRSSEPGALLESLEPGPEADVEAAWRQEVAARVAALDAGEVETTSWEEIREGFLARLSERRAG